MESVYDLARHEQLSGTAWNADAVRLEIQSIADDFSAALRGDGGWPTHPLDDEKRSPKWALYSGAAGAVVSLRILRRAGYVVPDCSSKLSDIHAAYLLNPDYGYETGLQLGEIGILTPAVLADPGSKETVNRLLDCMKKTVHHQAREITSGATGMMHAALTLFQQARNPVWRDLYCEAAQALWNSWARNDAGEWLWKSQIFGGVRTYYGACHGVAGNVHALLRGMEFLPPEWRAPILQRAADTMSHGVVRHEDDVNWPLSSETDPVGKKRLMQWCHGAPGVVTALSIASDEKCDASTRLDALIGEAAEAVWKAGPLTKGPGICHGTAGNGYAFLALYQRTGEGHWLDRARQFGMHAIEQSRRARARYGQGRYTLWTGDGGLAVYLHHCLDPRQIRFPGLEDF
jgi:hypothetical protein